MTWVDWVVTPLVGAVIGWCTNWIAIKMLFRPHTEKRIFGIKLPFTPGLIPKGRGKLAKTLGGTLGANVLTPEVLGNAIASPAVRDKINEALETGVSALEASDDTLGDWLGKLPGAEKDDLLTRAEGFALDRLAEGLDSPVLRDAFRQAAVSKLTGLPALLSPVWSGDSVRAFALEKGLGFVQNESFAAMLQTLAADAVRSLSADGRTLGELLPPRAAEALKTFAADKTPELVAYLSELPGKHPELDEALRAMVAQLAEQNFGRFIGLFVRYDTIYDNIKEKLFAYLAVPENQSGLREKAAEWADMLLAQNARDLLNRLPEDSREALVARLAALLQREIGEAQVASAVDFALGKAEGMDWSGLLPDGWEGKAADMAYDLLRAELSAAAPGFLHNLRGKLEAMKPADLLARVTPARRDKLLTQAADGAFALVKRAVPMLVEALNVAQLVEDKLNTFTTQEAETLVMGVVKRELSAITNLGALLGLVIGVVPLLLNLIR